MHMPNQAPTTGLELKLARVARRLKLREVGAAMGVGYSRVAHIESQDIVTVEMAERYLAALDTCRTGTPREGAA